MNRQETARLLAVMTTVWDHIVVDDATITAWEWGLEFVPYELVEPELKRWIRTNRWPPKPAELLEQIAERTVALPTPDEAWGLVTQRMRDDRPMTQEQMFQQAKWSAPAEVQAAVKQVGGLYTIRTSETPAAERKRFIEAYTAIRAAAIEAVQTGERPPTLRRIAPGIFASDAALLAFPAEPESLTGTARSNQP